MDSITSKVSPKVLLILSAGFLLFVVALFTLFSQLNGENDQTQSQNVSPDKTSSDSINGSDNDRLQTRKPAPQPGVIAKVGQEYLYEIDLNYEASYYPYEVTDEVQDELIDKMILDSRVLQAAAEEKLISLDDSVFNSPEKEYSKRIALIKQIRDQVNERSISFEGSYLTLWFHNGEPGPVGYERGKQIAEEKMRAIQQQVQSGALTMEQAAAELRADTSLRQVDPSYDSNVYVAFSVQGNSPITIDPAVDLEIRKLQEGQTSSILPLDDANSSDRPIHAAFVIAQVSRSENGGPGFTEWVQGYETEFIVERYE